MSSALSQCLSPEPGAQADGRQVSWKGWSLAASQGKIGFSLDMSLSLGSLCLKMKLEQLALSLACLMSVSPKQRAAVVSVLQSRWAEKGSSVVSVVASVPILLGGNLKSGVA